MKERELAGGVCDRLCSEGRAAGGAGGLRSSRIWCGLIRCSLGRLLADDSGNYLTITAVLMPVLIGFAGLATDAGLWLYAHQTMQAAADSGAVSAATAYAVSNASNLTVQASAVTSYYGFVNGTDGVTVTANRPPTSGAYQGSSNAVEVIVQQPQRRFLSA